MRLFISVDMEGISGVVHAEHTSRDGKEHERARKLMTEEANAAIKGALEAGAKDVIVNDSHGTMRNILPDKLHPEAKLILGSPKKLGMMEGMDGNHDAAICIGYHTMAGTDGILNHTFNSRVIRSISLNGEPFGEFGLNSLLAGYYGVPVVFVSGCNHTIAEEQSHIPAIHYAQVKRTIHRTSAENLHPSVACKQIKTGVKKALSNKAAIPPYKLDTSSYDVVMSFLNTSMADAAEMLPTTKRVDALSVAFTSQDFLECYRMIRALTRIAR